MGGSYHSILKSVFQVGLVYTARSRHGCKVRRSHQDRDQFTITSEQNKVTIDWGQGSVVEYSLHTFELQHYKQENKKIAAGKLIKYL